MLFRRESQPSVEQQPAPAQPENLTARAIEMYGLSEGTRDIEEDLRNPYIPFDVRVQATDEFIVTTLAALEDEDLDDDTRRATIETLFFGINYYAKQLMEHNAKHEELPLYVEKALDLAPPPDPNSPTIQEIKRHGLSEGTWERESYLRWDLRHDHDMRDRMTAEFVTTTMAALENESIDDEARLKTIDNVLFGIGSYARHCEGGGFAPRFTTSVIVLWANTAALKQKEAISKSGSNVGYRL